MEFSTRYKPKKIEDKWYEFWEENSYFKPEFISGRFPYSIVIPPPNITGILHMGHALNNTIQDILIRYNRMKHMRTLWIPGTDHAGIATQNVVEKKLQRKGLKRENIGREKFIDRVWEWKEEYGNTIVHQLKKIGCSCDWSRIRFTMDEGLSNAVKEVFIRLYREGLIYRGNYIINWCPRCHTALSDEEVEHEETEGKLYYIKYPIVQSSRQKHGGQARFEVQGFKKAQNYIIVATTRPETMLGDVAVAFHPEDKRIKELKNKTVILPLLNRKLEVIRDNLVDPKFGTGIVKITPAHDPNDFEMGLRHKLSPVCIFNPDATMNKNAQRYEGLDRIECRKKIVKDLSTKNLIEKVEKHTHQVGHCYRCHTVIEPLISKQWFVKMKPLAKPAIKVVKQGKIKFYPERWTKVYLNWMENIRDWCISRQIWWGHRLPVYYCENCQGQESERRRTRDEEPGNLNENQRFPSGQAKDKKGIIVAREKPDKCPDCGSSKIIQEEDVLDTWFSSWLWPFSTMGWPEETKDLKTFYPTDTLVTAQEIIFFWVARMIMAGLNFMKKIPFEHVYIHGTVRDDTGAKMSKSLGNIIDPIDIIEKFGADALRFSIISITAMGQDVFLSTEKFHLGRNFSNKVWNASRLVFLNSKEGFENYPLIDLKTTQNKNVYLINLWILGCLNSCISKVSKTLETYNFNQASDEIYHFFWHTYCDWYLEFIKPLLNDSNVSEKGKSLIKKTSLYILINSLKLLHPFMPFITEEIWQRIKEIKNINITFPDMEESIMISKWPEPNSEYEVKLLPSGFELLIDLISTIRNIKSELGIPLSKTTNLYISGSNKDKLEKIERYKYFIKNIANVGNLKIGQRLEEPSHSATGVIEGIQIFIPLEGIIDLDKEKKRIKKNLTEAEKLLKISKKKLDNRQFQEKAPEEVVIKEKEKYKNFLLRKEKLEKTLSELN